MSAWFLDSELSTCCHKIFAYQSDAPIIVNLWYNVLSRVARPLSKRQGKIGTGTGIFRVKAGRGPRQGTMQFYI